MSGENITRVSGSALADSTAVNRAVSLRMHDINKVNKQKVSRNSTLRALELLRLEKKENEILRAKIKKLEAGLKAVNKQLEMVEKTANKDKLTGIGNRARMDKSLLKYVRNLTRTNHSLSLVMIDLDNLKEINDSHGHLMGDRAISKFADALKKSTRGLDMIFRFGGDEFVAILPDTDHGGAKKFIDRVVKLLSNGVSISAGSATINGQIERTKVNENIKFLLNSADRAMYFNKSAKKLKRE
jgi:diguanylate cyclase (GGDEF)-like protein